MTEVTQASQPRRLYFYHEIDPWQQDNHYIRSGYVKELGTFSGCLELLTYFHNETVNIYSHLIPSSALFWVVLYYVNHQLKIYPNYLGVWEKLNFLQFALAATLCLFMSLTFHCLKAHSHKVCKVGNQLDYFGIVILITASLISIVLFAFYDEFWYKVSFVGLFLGLGLVCTVLTLNPKFATPAYRPFRSGMFIVFGLSGVVPVLVAVNIYGGDVAWERAHAKYLVLEGVFYILGAVLYALRIPERFTHKEHDGQPLLDKPGPFDLVGHSHQIFHVFVVIAAWCHWTALVGCYHYLHTVTLRA